MFQPEACNIIAEHCKEHGLNIWVYTGFTFEELLELAKKKPVYLDFLKKIDYVDFDWHETYSNFIERLPGRGEMLQSAWTIRF